MPRIQYNCICDKCGEQVKPNDENDVSFNGLKLVYCESCFENLYAIWEKWDESANYREENTVQRDC